jgi:hypothetical protein
MKQSDLVALVRVKKCLPEYCFNLVHLARSIIDGELARSERLSRHTEREPSWVQCIDIALENAVLTAIPGYLGSR